MLSVRRLHCNQ